MITFNKITALMIIIMAFLVTACDDSMTGEQSDLEALQGQQPDTELQHLGDLSILDAVVSGRTIRNIELPLLGGEEFTGRITNLQLTEGDDPGTVVASGRLIGWVNGERINQRFEDLVLQVFDLNGDLIDGSAVCQILYLELGPIFLDVLGLIVEVPDPIVVEVRAERGPGNLLGNLLCGLVGILD